MLPILGRILLLGGIAAAYWASVRITHPDVLKLVQAAPKARTILSELLRADLTTREVSTTTVALDFPVPCESAPLPLPLEGGPRLSLEPGCAAARETFTMRGVDLGAGATVRLRWRLADGATLGIKQLQADQQGQFSLEAQVRPIVATKDGIAPQVEMDVDSTGGRLRPSQALHDVVDAMFITVFMALLATTVGTVIAAPLSFLAAGNILRGSRLGSAVYVAVRGFLNLTRSYEALVLATIFALIVGFGSPYAGMLALVVTTTASLGKMFSESVESIDPGPLEAIAATGASRWQVVVYGVVPQIIPDFLSYTIYHWDINVRMSTIIGFVGGGGIGYYLSQRISTLEYSKAGTALLAIVIVVWVLDFLSAQIRKRTI